MPSMFEPITALLTPEMFATAGERLGMPGEQVQRGAAIAIPLLARGVMSIAETPEGQVRIANAVKDTDAGVLGNISGFMASFAAAGGDDMLRRVFGDEGRVVVSAVKEATDIDITPILGMTGPLLLGLLNNIAQREGLDTNGLIKKLKQEARGFSRQKDGTATVVDSVLAKVDEVRKLKASFSPADWAAMRNGPMAAAAAVVASTPSRVGKSAEEFAAAIAAIPDAARDARPTSLLAALYHNGTDGMSAEGIADPMAAVTRAAAVVKEHAPAESAAYNKLMLRAAYAAAEATKEGGFLGIGARRISPAEQTALDALAATLGA